MKISSNYAIAIMFICSIFFSHLSFAQEQFTISGYIKDAATGETLIGATVYIEETGNGAVSNVYGFYSISLPPGEYSVSYRFVGYNNESKEINLTENVKIDVELGESDETLEEIVITGEAEDENVSSLEMSVNKLDIKTIQKIPSLLGEADLIRSIQLLPGVSTVGEGASGFNVRGGGVGQNLVLLDEAPVYNSSHLLGFFSVFNPDAVKDVKLIKGGIPAQYGGRLSSILDVRMKEGNYKRLSASGGIGTIFSRLTLEGPIVKDKGSFVIAGRRSYADVLAKPFISSTSFSDAKLYFYDLTMKGNYTIDDKNRIFLSGYLGRDVFKFDGEQGFSWGNTTTTLRWNHLFNDRLFSNVTLFYSNYDYELKFGEDDDVFEWNSKIINYSVKPEFTYYINTKNELTFGGQMILFDFEPAETSAISAGEYTEIALDNKYALESAVYLANQQTINSKLSLQYGIRLSMFNYMGPGSAYEYNNPEPGTRKSVVSSEEYDRWESIKRYINPEARFNLKYQLNKESSIKASYNRMVQYIHLVSNTTASNPLDVWTPSTNNIKPQKADQVALGYFRNFKENAYEASVEVYYKKIYDIVDYIDGADLLINRYLEGDLLAGEGRAFGAEFYLKKTTGKFNGWISYTLSRSERQVEGINRGAWYPNRFDQLHNLSVVAFYDFSKRVTLSANFAYNSGTPATFPNSKLIVQGYVVPHSNNYARNNVRIPDYHRLDFSLTLNAKEKPNRKNDSYWVFSLYNVYNRKNPFSIYFNQTDDRINPQTQAFKVAIFGSVIPAVSYNFKF
ncbi:TonB-dependent receptor [Chondrinema litorale]|uniref:TonB-dependent receptor n=1 Tax=Chondrinema litorale TaxID=2994555 RepID=UPI003D6E83B3